MESPLASVVLTWEQSRPGDIWQGTDIWSVVATEDCVPGSWWVEVRGAVKHPIRARVAPTTIDPLAPNVNGVELRNPTEWGGRLAGWVFPYYC